MAEFYDLRYTGPEEQFDTWQKGQFEDDPVRAAELCDLRWDSFLKEYWPDYVRRYNQLNKSPHGPPRKHDPITQWECQFDARCFGPYSIFDRSSPKNIPHWDMFSFNGGIDNSPGFVSKAWKDAIESLEPNVHQFVSHDLRFTDSVKTGYYCMRVGHACTITVGGAEARFIDRDESTWPPKPIIKRSAIGGRHFVFQSAPGYHIIVSSDLAKLLRPLLPDWYGLSPLMAK